MKGRTAVIIGAGPAGLTAAYELLEQTDIKPILFEATGDIGGISKTINYKGNRIDIGGHRFFSKSDRVMDWWQSILPLQGSPARDDLLLGRKVPLSDRAHAPDPEREDRVMLVRSRLSRILFLQKLFNYPIALDFDTLIKLGLKRIAKMGLAYFRIRLFPIREEKTLEDFFINRFGQELYLTFFKDYSEKVWGVSCNEIKPEWGAQRVKNLSITKVLTHAVRRLHSKENSILQKNLETSLIGQFLYPKLGPGQLWEEVARRITDRGGEIHLRHQVVGLQRKNGLIAAAEVLDRSTEGTNVQTGDYFFSTMPVKDLFQCFGDGVDPESKRVADGLRYRDFISVGVLVSSLKMRNEDGIHTLNHVIPDNWIYVQEPGVALGRLHVFNNWSPYMVQDPNTVWLGLEYFCNEGDGLWSRPDDEIIRLAIDELARIDVIEKDSVLDSTLIRMPKAYPAYFGTYDELHVLRAFTERISNLFLIGRNGMHRYNNQDHSMLTAMRAVEHIVQGLSSKDHIWDVNAGEEYHEEN
jgi:protoporphyrinogen oxidase